ncbi:hypothetical protein H2201_005258 [Coniosporium apollinis]|uniref:Major facilitator superfamily (MFS) profile domain-containing protein n=1 Tax=Coniosporium apollinis TaxID=61459 RepID=A0ABQ9NTG5_9PEZI|nr:hypothetical protein H2201_005258 [Coniosporium apollinis]
MVATDTQDMERTPLLQAHEEAVDGDDERKPYISRLRGFAIGSFVFILIFLQACNISLLTTTQGLIAADYDAFSEVSWFTSTYLIAMSSVTPLGGRLSRIFSPRAYITASACISALGVLVTAFAPTLAVFLVGRGITGVGAAGVLSVVIILVLELASEKRRGLFIGLINSGMTIGVSLGAVIAGAMAPKLGWRIVFWVQVPILLLAGFGIFAALPQASKKVEHPDKPPKRSIAGQLSRIDYLGAVLLVSFVVLFLYALSAHVVHPLYIVVSLLLLALFVLVESKYATEPFIPVTVLKSRGTLLSCLATLGMMAARWSVLFYTPVYAIAVRGWKPAEAGLILLPTNAGFALGGLLAGLFHIRRAGSFYVSCILTFAFFAASLFLLSQISTPSSSVTAYVIATFLNGLVTGASLNYTLAHLLHLAPKSLHIIVTPLLAMFRGFAGSFGSAIGGGIFARSLKSTLERGFAENGLLSRGSLIRTLMGSPVTVQGLTGVEKEVAVHGYVVAIRALFVAGAILALVAGVVQAGTGWKGHEDLPEEEERVRREEERAGGAEWEAA